MALSLHPEAIIHRLVLVPSSVGLWAVSAVADVSLKALKAREAIVEDSGGAASNNQLIRLLLRSICLVVVVAIACLRASWY